MSESKQKLMAAWIGSWGLAVIIFWLSFPPQGGPQISELVQIAQGLGIAGLICLFLSLLV